MDYNTNDSVIHIDLVAAYQYGTVVWPDDGLATMVPVPRSAVGEISKDDETGFLAYVANTPIDDFKSYIALCVDRGFTVDAHDAEKAYLAKNSEGYRLSVEYQGNNVICIAVDEPEYEVSIEVEFVANLIFSKYDVDFFIDADKQDTLKHGNNWEKTLKLEKGEHIIKFANTEDSSVCGEVTISITSKTEVAYKISCYADKVTVDMLYINMDVELANNEVKILCSESEFLGKNYKDVENELITAGFINVKTVPVYDIYFGITDVESVDDVSISGSDDFKRGDIFLNDVEIVITYHLSYEDDPEYQPAEDVENESTESKSEDDERILELLETIENDESYIEYRNVYEKVVNQPYVVVRDMMKELGYTAEYEHENTHLDFTGELTYYTDDELNNAGFIVTGISAMDYINKTITLYVNTNENIERIENQKKSNTTMQKESHYDVDAEILDEYAAWDAVEAYGKMMYPKFKLHYRTGKLSAKQVDDNTWDLKSLCDVDTGYGTMESCNCEATVEGTNFDAEVTYFIVY